MTFDNWIIGQPGERGNTHCGEIADPEEWNKYVKFQWNDQDCDYKQKFICQKAGFKSVKASSTIEHESIRVA
jgi:hypothetical protein